MAKAKQNRGKELLLLAADALDDGRDPFSTAFLSEHEVTADQCFTLGQQMAVAVRNYARLADSELVEAVIRASTEFDEGEREAMIANLRRHLAMNDCLEKLGKLTGKRGRVPTSPPPSDDPGD